MGFNSGITLYGYYSQDPSILDDVVLPEGLDRSQLTLEILHSCGMLYPFIQHPQMLKEGIHNWFAINERNFERILLAVMAEYSPIENYDRTEVHIIKRAGTETDSRTNSGNSYNELNDKNSSESTRSGSNSAQSTTNSTTSTNTDGTETDQRAADNSETFRNTTKKISDADSSSSDYSHNSAGGTESENSTTSGSDIQTNRSNENSTTSGELNRNEDVVENIRAHGNIGTTRNSEMVLDEIELRKYNIYEDIASRFADKFLLCIF